MARVAYTYKSSTMTAAFRNVDADGAKYSMTLAQPSDCTSTGCANGDVCGMCFNSISCHPADEIC